MQWQPTREGYLRFLTESKQVYDTVESIIAEAPFPECEHPLPIKSSCMCCLRCSACLMNWLMVISEAK